MRTLFLALGFCTSLAWRAIWNRITFGGLLALALLYAIGGLHG